MFGPTPLYNMNPSLHPQPFFPQPQQQPFMSQPYLQHHQVPSQVVYHQQAPEEVEEESVVVVEEEEVVQQEAEETSSTSMDQSDLETQRVSKQVANILKQDPNFQNSEFLQFMSDLGDGKVLLRENQVVENEMVENEIEGGIKEDENEMEGGWSGLNSGIHEERVNKLSSSPNQQQEEGGQVEEFEDGDLDEEGFFNPNSIRIQQALKEAWDETSTVYNLMYFMYFRYILCIYCGKSRDKLR